jgi:hypothetical protein
VGLLYGTRIPGPPVRPPRWGHLSGLSWQAAGPGPGPLCSGDGPQAGAQCRQLAGIAPGSPRVHRRAPSSPVDVTGGPGRAYQQKPGCLRGRPGRERAGNVARGAGGPPAGGGVLCVCVGWGGGGLRVSHWQPARWPARAGAPRSYVVTPHLS